MFNDGSLSSRSNQPQFSQPVSNLNPTNKPYTHNPYIFDSPNFNFPKNDGSFSSRPSLNPPIFNLPSYIQQPITVQPRVPERSAFEEEEESMSQNYVQTPFVIN